MNEMTRREAMQIMGAATVTAALPTEPSQGLTTCDVVQLLTEPAVGLPTTDVSHIRVVYKGEHPEEGWPLVFDLNRDLVKSTKLLIESPGRGSPHLPLPRPTHPATAIGSLRVHAETTYLQPRRRMCMQRPSRQILLLGASSLLAALGRDQSVLHVGLLPEPDPYTPTRRSQICPWCQIPHRTGKAFCSANCCRAYRKEKRA